MALDVKEITAEVNQKAAEYIAKICFKKQNLDIEEILQLRNAYMSGALAVLTSIHEKIKKPTNETDNNNG